MTSDKISMDQQLLLTDAHPSDDNDPEMGNETVTTSYSSPEDSDNNVEEEMIPQELPETFNCEPRQPCHSKIAENRMRRRLQFYFMNPIEKWQAKRQFPYKFAVQLVKIVLVTLQLCLFAHSQYIHVNYTWDSRTTFSHLFLKGWDTSREVNGYPPATGPLALYKTDEFYETIDYAYKQYANLTQAIGTYSYDSEDNSMVAPEVCLFRYKKGTIFGFNESYVFDSEVVENCFNINMSTMETDGIRSQFRTFYGDDIKFSEFIRAYIKFSVKTVNFRASGYITPPNCYKFYIKIVFDNQDNDGQMLLSLDTVPLKLICKGDTKYTTDNEINNILRSLLNYFVMLVCSVSLVLCSRAIYRAQQLKKLCIVFFQRFFNYELTGEDRFEFLNVWYVVIIINDVLIILGSAIKEQIENKQFVGDRWNVCSVFLGTGNMLVWFGVLRYLGFFKTYNVVILTLKAAAPTVYRFLICALIIYSGFTFAGWLVLGPYHMKFRSLATTSECLFSLINGDDMFASFTMFQPHSPLLWWYSRIYLYTFISLYIYVVLSLFIAVITDAYDTVKSYYKHGAPKSYLQKFVGETSIEEMSSGVYRTASTYNLTGLLT